MNLTPAYIEGFAEVCADIGLSEKQAAALLEVAATHLDLKNPEFAAGFKEAMEKAAGFQAPDLTGAFSAPDPGIAKGMTGAGWGALAGGALGLASILKPSLARGPGGKGLLAKLTHNGKGFLNPGATGRLSHMVPDVRAAKRIAERMGPTMTAMNMPWKPKLESRLRYGMRRFFGPNNTRIFGGAAVGAGAGAVINNQQNILSGYGSNMPVMDHWLPENMNANGVQPQGQQSTGGGGFGDRLPPSPYDPVGSFSVFGQGGQGGQGNSQPANIGSQLDSQMQQLQGQMKDPSSIDNALHNNRIRSQMADLERLRVRQNSTSAITSGNHRSEMAQAGHSIAQKLKEVEKAISTRESRAGGAASWMERSGGPTTLSNFVPQLMNKALGNEAGAQQISAELQELYRARQALNQQLAQSGQNR